VAIRSENDGEPGGVIPRRSRGIQPKTAGNRRSESFIRGNEKHEIMTRSEIKRLTDFAACAG
jgi:hypothetical protein